MRHTPARWNRMNQDDHFHFPQAERAARLRADARLHAGLPVPHRADSARGGVRQDRHARLGAVRGRGHRAARAGVVPAHLRRRSAALVNAVFGLLVAWVLVRYTFPGKRVVDALVDLPFALPTAVAGIALDRRSTRATAGSAQLLEPLGIKVAFTPLGVLVALTFIGLPFVVRTVQPVLEDLERELEEAAATLGATRWQTFRRVILPIAAAGAAHRLRARVRARARRIRLGDLHRRQHADEVGDHAAAHHHQARAVRLRGRDGDRRRDAGRRRSCCCSLINVLQALDAPAAASAMTPTSLPSTAAAEHAAPAPSRRTPRGRRASEPRWVRAALLIGVALAFLALFLFVPLVAVFVRGAAQGRRRLLRGAHASPTRWPRSGSRCSPRRSPCRSTSCSASRRRGRSRSSSSAARALLIDADRPAVLGLAGHRRPDLRAGLRRAGLVRPVAARRTTSRSSSPCRASCWRRSSSPFRSSRAS